MFSLQKNTDECGHDTAPRRLMRQLFEYAPDALLVVSNEDKIVMSNLRAQKLFGYESKELVGRSPLTLLPGWLEAFTSYRQLADQSSEEGPGRVSNMLAVRNFGDEFCAEVALGKIAQGNNPFTVVSIREKTPNSLARRVLETINEELKVTNANLMNLSKTDPLTQLLNRRGLETVLQREISYSKRNKTELVAALIDLDDFKSVNDYNGHASGDRVLKEVARTLKEALRTVDWIGRVGGDEFLILLPSTSLVIAVKVAERVRLELATRLIRTIAGGTSRLTASLGVARLPTSVRSIEEVLELTTNALKSSKHRGKNRVSFGKPDQIFDAEQCKQKTLLNDGNDHCTVLTQSIVRMHDEKVIGYELFSSGPAGPLEMPEEFFRISDDNKLALFDLHCLKLCLERAQSLPEHLTSHINILPSTLRDVATAQLIELIQSQVKKRKICLEISSRRILTDPTYLKKPVQALRSNGISISLDDIGYGYSALESILSLEPDSIKIDGKYIQGLAHNQDKRNTVSKLVKLSGSIGLRTIAEGVETRDDFLVVQQLNVDLGQGWYWGQPVA